LLGIATLACCASHPSRRSSARELGKSRGTRGDLESFSSKQTSVANLMTTRRPRPLRPALDPDGAIRITRRRKHSGLELESLGRSGARGLPRRNPKFLGAGGIRVSSRAHDNEAALSLASPIASTWAHISMPDMRGRDRRGAPARLAEPLAVRFGIFLHDLYLPTSSL
jgi:hypothetical protein